MRGATNKSNDVSAARTISIHAPHAGRDNFVTVTLTPTNVFQSTRPMRGATGEDF